MTQPSYMLVKRGCKICKSLHSLNMGNVTICGSLAIHADDTVHRMCATSIWGNASPSVVCPISILPALNPLSFPSNVFSLEEALFHSYRAVGKYGWSNRVLVWGLWEEWLDSGRWLCVPTPHPSPPQPQQRLLLYREWRLPRSEGTSPNGGKEGRADSCSIERADFTPG